MRNLRLGCVLMTGVSFLPLRAQPSLPALQDSTVQRDVDANWRRDLELYDRAMLVADPINVLTCEDLEKGKFSFTGDLLNLLPGVPEVPGRTAATRAAP